VFLNVLENTNGFTIWVAFVLDTNDKGKPSLGARVDVRWMDKRMGDGG